MNEQLNTLYEEIDALAAGIDSVGKLVYIVWTEVFTDGNFPRDDEYFRYLHSFEEVLIAAHDLTKRLADKMDDLFDTVRNLIDQLPKSDPAAENKSKD